ncbi:hypothetical protein [Brevundimonas sp.]|uniref:hypothetical protein n=1 Tax=Brevundimonas sp. TaxID=1871086 RepID=UPI002FC5A37D
MGSFSPFQPNDEPAYAGWIPTITGQLSFSLIGLGGAAPDCVTANVEFQDAQVGHPRRRVAVIQRRVTKDLPLTFQPIPYFFRSIAAEFILLGDTHPATRPVIHEGEAAPRHDEIGVLSGEILVLPHHKDQPSVERSFVRKLRERIATIGDATPRAVIGGEDALAQELNALQDAAARGGLTLAHFRFELYRTGEFRLQQVETIMVEPDGDLEQEEFDAILASQVYYFVKDIAHRHYHHRRSSDNLLPLTPLRGDDDVSWRRETLWSLARAVLEMRRSGKLPGHKSALGVLAYAEAFQGLLARVERRADQAEPFKVTHEIACYDFTHTRQSLEATIAEKGFLHSHWTSIHGLLIATGLAAAALWLAAVQVREQACRPDMGCPVVPNIMKAGIEIMIEMPHILAAGLVVLAAIYLEASRRSLMAVTPLRVWGEFLGSWIDALGATISRWARRRHPTWGDQIGATLALAYFFFFVPAGLYSLGGLLHLWPFPWQIFSAWFVSVALLIVLPILTRLRGAKR